MVANSTDIRAADMSSEDAQVIGEYLRRQPLHNIYLIHALAWMAADRAAPASARTSDMGGFWGTFAETSTLAGLLLIEPQDRPGSSHRPNTGCPIRPCVGYLAYPDQTTGCHHGPSTRSGSHLASLGCFAAQSGVRTLIGHRLAVEQAIEGLPAWQIQTRLLHFYQADPERLVRSYAYPVRRATEDDIPELVELYRGYEFSRRDTTDDEIGREIEQAMNQSGVYFCVEAPNEQACANPTGGTSGSRVFPPCGGEVFPPRQRIVSAARVYPETDGAGLIGAARTLPEYRGQGIYLAVRTASFEHLFAQGKAGVGMFLDTNTSMHQVIRKQGGTILAQWLIADLQPQPRRALVRLRRRLVPSQIRQWAIHFRDVSKAILNGENTHNDM